MLIYIYNINKKNIFFIVNKIKKIGNYIVIHEDRYDTPDNVNSMILNKIKNRMINIFSKYDKKNKKSAHINLNKNIKRIGSNNFVLDDITTSDYSKLYDYLILYFYDDVYYYIMYISVKIDDTDDIKKIDDFNPDIRLKLKKYNLINNEYIGQIVKNIKLKDIDDKLIYKLNDELDEFYEIK